MTGAMRHGSAIPLKRRYSFGTYWNTVWGVVMRVSESRLFLRSLFLLIATTSVFLPAVPSFKAEALPGEISDEVFWNLVVNMSEPDGSFQFENFVSNELGYQWVIPRLLEGTESKPITISGKRLKRVVVKYDPRRVARRGRLEIWAQM